jgi:hypothetical protein
VVHDLGDRGDAHECRVAAGAVGQVDRGVGLQGGCGVHPFPARDQQLEGRVDDAVEPAVFQDLNHRQMLTLVLTAALDGAGRGWTVGGLGSRSGDRWGRSWTPLVRPPNEIGRQFDSVLYWFWPILAVSHLFALVVCKRDSTYLACPVLRSIADQAAPATFQANFRVVSCRQSNQRSIRILGPMRLLSRELIWCYPIFLD